MPCLNLISFILDSLFGFLPGKAMGIKLYCKIGKYLMECCHVTQAKREYTLFVWLNSFRLDIEDLTIN